MPFSNANVGTTLCHSFAGSALEKSSWNKSSFFLAIASLGIGGRSAANVMDVTKVERANM
jgi:hypothetical protein